MVLSITFVITFPLHLSVLCQVSVPALAPSLTGRHQVLLSANYGPMNWRIVALFWYKWCRTMCFKHKLVVIAMYILRWCSLHVMFRLQTHCMEASEPVFLSLFIIGLVSDSLPYIDSGIIPARLCCFYMYFCQIHLDQIRPTSSFPSPKLSFYMYTIIQIGAGWRFNMTS